MDSDGTPLREWHLRYCYAGGAWIKVAESHGLRREHREVELEVLRGHFEKREPGRFQFDWLDPETLSPLERARPQPGPLQPPNPAREALLAITTSANPVIELTDDEQQAICVRDAARKIEGELRALERKGVLSEIPRAELIAHFATMVDATREEHEQAAVLNAPPLALRQPTRTTGQGESSPSVGLPNLKKYDRQAYQLSLMHGMTQDKIAEILNREHGLSIKQGQVSRMIARAKRHANASGLTELIPTTAQREKAVDPSRLELGKRTDGRSYNLRAKAQESGREDDQN